MENKSSGYIAQSLINLAKELMDKIESDLTIPRPPTSITRPLLFEGMGGGKEDDQVFFLRVYPGDAVEGPDLRRITLPFILLQRVVDIYPSYIQIEKLRREAQQRLKEVEVGEREIALLKARLATLEEEQPKLISNHLEAVQTVQDYGGNDAICSYLKTVPMYGEVPWKDGYIQT